MKSTRRPLFPSTIRQMKMGNVEITEEVILKGSVAQNKAILKGAVVERADGEGCGVQEGTIILYEV